MRDRFVSNQAKLFEWAARAVAHPLPEPVRRRAATILADDIGAMVAGSLEPQVASTTAAFLAKSVGNTSTVFARGAPRADRDTAACANGMAITWCELDEGFRNASCHAGAYTLPALLAECEALGRTVDETVRALAVAYEVTTRFALACPFPTLSVHPHAAWATLGAALGVGAARRLDAKTLAAAVTGAASMTFAGPFDTAVEGSLVRNGWTSAGAWIGMRAADWAAAGIGGGAATIHDVFAVSFHTGVRPDALVEDLGERWSVTNGYHKIFACCQYAHTAIEATLELLQTSKGRSVDDLAEIVVETGPGGMALTTVEPDTVLAAKFSIPHAVAATTRLGTGGARAFTYDTLRDEGIAGLRRKVTLAPYPNVQPAPNDRPARITWKFHGGDQVSATCESARGGSDRPFDEATLLAKLADNAAATFPRLPAALARVIAGDPSVTDVRWKAFLEAHL